MVRNYLTIAIRNLLKRRVYSIINILGLSLGVAACLVILRYVDFQLSYDNFNKNADHTFRVVTSSYRNGEFRGTSVLSSYAYGPSLSDNIPEIRYYVRTHPMYGGAVVSSHRDGGEPSTFREENLQFVDSTFFDVFTYNALEGNLRTALQNPNSVVITEKMADKYFGKDDDPLGKILTVSGGWADGDYEITAVLGRVPQNAHFTFDFLFPTHNLLRSGQYQNDDGWGWYNFVTYVELEDKANLKNAEEKLPAFVDEHFGDELKESNGKDVMHFQPVRSIHLSPGYTYETSATVSPNTIYFFIIISIFILAIAWVNYINLSTARAMERAREVGIKKTVGAHKAQLIRQFIFEAFLVNLFSVVLAVVIATLLLPVLGQIVGKEFIFDFMDVRFWAVLFGLFIVGTLISGGYPAFVLSSFNAIEVLKGRSERITGRFSLRKVLVVFQFASSLVLIAGTFAVYRQITFMQNQDKGLRMKQMLVVNGPSVRGDMSRQQGRQRLITFKNEAVQLPGVISVATSGAIPGGGYNWGTSMRRDGAQVEENKSGSIVWIDPDFIETYGITVLAGRQFNLGIKSDMESVLVNEAALKAFGLGTPEQAVKERLIISGDTTEILGVLKNYNWNSLKTEHTPFLFKADTISGHDFSMLLSGAHIKETISTIEGKYKEAFPGNPFDYFFLDDFFNSQYKAEQQFGRIFGLFSLLAIAIACLGLWGLAAFTTDQKLKEIGIRKALGASIGGIMKLLTAQFVRLVIVACVIALPLSWFGIDRWLSDFAFRIGLQWDLFVVPVVILLVLTLGTVSMQVLRGASINPARILRTE